MKKLKLEHRADGWYILLPSSCRSEEFGPYATKTEALSDKKGVESFIAEHPQDFSEVAHERVA